MDENVQAFFRRNGVGLIVNNRVQNMVLGGSLKKDRMISVSFQGKSINIIVIQVYVPTTDVKEAGVDLWRPTRPYRTNTKKHVLFNIGDWSAKVGSQEIPGITGKFGLEAQNDAKQRLADFCQ